MNHRQRKKLSRHLLETAQIGDTPRVRALLRTGADPERGDRAGTTSPHGPSVNGEAETARALLTAGAATDAPTAPTTAW
ncbi:hypothetical protein [Streptomyces sp. MMG1121]|uniref:hypothetical protein n=1 Tax=Streptomyces sp. MMG1121 TaxID=1415544 RepID=UPI0006AFBA0B|nr:hypothetical protein [Streptomyces sp. MMG1121]